MNKREAKAYALQLLAAEARHHRSNGSAWLFSDERPGATGETVDFSEADVERIADAVDEIADELDARARRMTRRIAARELARRTGGSS